MAIIGLKPTWDENLAHKTKSIAVLEGGGALGLITAHTMAAYANQSGSPFHTHFDDIHGESVGALNAAALWPLAKTGTPLKTPEELKTIYYNEMDDVFDYRWTSLGGTLRSKYDAGHLEKLLEDHFGDLRLSDFEDGLNIHVFDRETGTEKILSSDKAKIDKKEDYLIRDVLRAATAAPLVFDQVEIKNMTGETKKFTDAAMIPGDTSYWVYRRAANRATNPDNIVVSTFGTGYRAPEAVNQDELNDGALGSGEKTLSELFNGAAKTGRALAKAEMGGRYVVLDVPIGADITMTSKMKDIKPFAEKAEQATKDAIKKSLEQIEKLDRKQTPVFQIEDYTPEPLEDRGPTIAA